MEIVEGFYGLSDRTLTEPQRVGWRRDEVEPSVMFGLSYMDGDLARAIYDHRISGDLHVQRDNGPEKAD